MRAASASSRRRPLFGLAPGGVWRAPSVTRRAVGSYSTVSPLLAICMAGGLFSVPLSFGSRRLAVSQHPALWSSDFPRAESVDSARDHLSDSGGKLCIRILVLLLCALLLLRFHDFVPINDAVAIGTRFNGNRAL